MRVIRAFITSVEVVVDDISRIGDEPGWNQLPTGVILNGKGVLADKSQVYLKVKPTADERDRLFILLEEIATRIISED